MTSVNDSKKDKCFVAQYRFCSELEEAIERHEQQLFVKSSHYNRLSMQLGTHNYTRLVISDGIEHEIVCVWNEQGRLLMDRAQENTRAQVWQCGSRISFEWTPMNMFDQAAAAAENCPEVPEEKEDKLPSYTLCLGNYDYEVKDGLIVDRRSVRCLPKGCVDNMSAVFSECGCLVDAAEGENLLNRRIYQSECRQCGKERCNGSCS